MSIGQKNRPRDNANMLQIATGPFCCWHRRAIETGKTIAVSLLDVIGTADEKKRNYAVLQHLADHTL